MRYHILLQAEVVRSDGESFLVAGPFGLVRQNKKYNTTTPLVRIRSEIVSRLISFLTIRHIHESSGCQYHWTNHLIVNSKFVNIEEIVQLTAKTIPTNAIARNPSLILSFL